MIIRVRPPSVITIDSSKSSPSPVKKSNSTADDVKNDCEIICIGNVNEYVIVFIFANKNIVLCVYLRPSN